MLGKDPLLVKGQTKIIAIKIRVKIALKIINNISTPLQQPYYF